MWMRVAWICCIVCMVSLLSAAVNAQPGKQTKEPSGLRSLRVIKAYPKKVRAIQFSPDGKELLASGGFALRIWDPRTGKMLREAGIHGKGLGFAIYASEGKILACTAGTENVVHLLDAQTLKLRCSIDSHTSSVDCLAAASKGNLAAFAVEAEIRLFDASTGKVTRRIRLVQQDSCRSMVISPDNRILAAGIDNTGLNMVYFGVRRWDLTTGKEMPRVPLPPNLRNGLSPRALAFGPSGSPFAIGMDGQSVVPLWDLSKNKPLREIDWTIRFDRKKNPRPDDESTIPSAGVAALCFSRDGKTLLTACADGKLRLWEVASGRLRHQADITAYMLALSPDGSVLATASVEEGIIRLWDWRDLGEKRLRLTAVTLEQLWRDCGSEDAALAYRAVGALMASPKEAMQLLSKRLQRVPPVSDERLKGLMRDLDADTADKRVQAFRQLEAIGRVAESAIRSAKNQAASAEVKRSVRRLLWRLRKWSSEEWRALRAVEVLEAIASPEAKRLLTQLAGGGDAAVLTQDARAALKRLREPQQPGASTLNSDRARKRLLRCRGSPGRLATTTLISAERVRATGGVR